MIKIKGIWHERSEDAPFVGALISAIECKFNCNNCFNQHIKDLPNLEYNVEDIIKIVKSDKFNQGIILAGLEWTLQPNDLRNIVKSAIDNNLKVMLYTGNTEEIFLNSFKDLTEYPIYIKYGQYDENKRIYNKFMYNVNLASDNQYIKYYGKLS